MCEKLTVLFSELQEALNEATLEDCPAIIGALEQAKARAWSRMIMNGPSADDDRPDKLLTVAEVATMLSIPESRGYELIRQGKIESMRIGKYVRVDPAKVTEYKTRLGGKKA